MNVYFDKCSDAVAHATQNKSYGIYYSEMQNPNTDMHVHECCELLFCLSGGRHFLIDDKMYEVNDGDVFLMNQFEAHKITFEPGMVFARFVLEIHPAFLFEISSEETGLADCFNLRGNGIANKLSLNEARMAELEKLFLALHEDSGYGDEISKRTVVIRIMLLVNRLFQEQIKGAFSAKTDNKAVQTTISYIHTHYHDDITLEMLAKNAYISVNQLCRLFRLHCGTTITKYINSKRITEAKKMLIGGANVTDTAESCGFKDYANFIRVFKKYVGVSPGKYKK